MFKLLFDFWYIPFVFISSLLSEGDEWKITLSPNNVKGEKMIVYGIVYNEDGKTPAEGVIVYVYHTNPDGVYGKGDNLIDGTMITNSKGQYEFHSVKPGSYPEGENPAHVHYKITGKDFPEQWFELKFSGDKFLKESDYKKNEGKGTFSEIQKPLKSDDGILRYRMDVKLKK